MIYSVSVVFEVDLIRSNELHSSHILLGDKEPYSLVALLTSLNDYLFSGAKVSDNYNTPCSWNTQICFNSSEELKAQVTQTEVKK